MPALEPSPPAAPAAAPPAPVASGAASAHIPEVRSADVPFAYATSDGKGGVGTATIRILDYSKYEKQIPDRDKHVGIAVMEEFVNGTGELWQTSAWIAAFVATGTLNRNLLNYEMLVKVPGFVDGPSAGMLTTVTLMALLNGDPILPGRCITGAINLDGSIGPVGSLLAKLEGCKNHQIKHFGIPLGSQSARTGDGDKNVIEVARKTYDIEAKALTNVFDSYEFMTGRPLKERQDPEIDEADLELTQAIKEKFQGIAQASHGRLKEQFGVFSTKFERAPIARDFSEANRKAGADAAYVIELQKAAGSRFENGKTIVAGLIDAGESARADGNYVLAYHRTVMALRQMEMLSGSLLAENHRVLIPGSREESVLSGLDELAAKLSLRRSALTDKLKPLSRSVESALERRSLGAQMDAVQCSLYLAEAMAAFESGSTALKTFNELLGFWKKQAATDSEQRPDFGIVLHAFESANLAFSRAKANADMVADWIQCVMISDAKGLPARFEDIKGTVEQMARVYAAGSSAVLSAYDAVINARAVEGIQSSGADGSRPSEVDSAVAREFMHQRLAAQDPMIPVFRLASRRSAFVDVQSLDVSRELDSVLRCASGTLALLGGTRLVAQHYFIGSGTDSSGNVTLQSRGMLTSVLENARREVRRKAARLQRTIDTVPEGVRLDYQLAKVLQYEKEDLDRLQALFFYWRAGQMCTIAELCARTIHSDK